MVAVKKFFRWLCSRTYPLLSLFQNGDAIVECSTIVLLQIQSASLCF